ncbi:MAG TPA: DJ-1/PfpI family protein [Acidimicrobiales bacterium]|jgi:transcriptional regulator GlxA family with amidase domain|nr:DJ-1/PfpI family protein [Acidimicrobiales bacterium]
MQVAILVFDGITVLDAVGPYEVLGWLPGADVRLVGVETGPVRSAQGTLALCADYTLDDVPAPDVVLVPGGPGEEALRHDAEVLGWLRDAHSTSRWTTSVCTGACTLAAAGLLDGLEATTHWSTMETLRRLGATPVERRWVQSGRVITAAGVSAGIDMALHLLAVEAGDEVAQAAQLILEYDPQPPFDSGSPAKAPPHILQRLRERLTS